MTSTDPAGGALGPRHTVALPVGRVHYHERGDGPVVLLVGGFATNADLWRDLVPALADGYRVIAPDWPMGSHREAVAADADLGPHGLANVVAGFLDALDLREVTVIGNDSGWAVTQVLVTAHDPDRRVTRLVATPGDCFDNYPPKLFRPLQWLGRVPGMDRVVVGSMRFRWAQRLPIAYGYVATGGLPDDLADSFLLPARQSPEIRRDLRKVLLGMQRRATEEAAGRLGGFTGPVLIVWGAGELLFPLEHARRLADLFPDARLEVIDGARTYVMLEDPERFGTLVRDFLDVRQAGGSP